MGVPSAISEMESIVVVDKEELDIDQFVAEARKWDDLYLSSTIHAVELYEHQYQVQQVIQEFLSRKSSGDLKATNPFAKRIWLKELLIAFYGHECNRKNPVQNALGRFENEGGRYPLMAGLKEGYVACALVTFTDESWACPDTHIQFDLHRAKQKVRNALSGLSFIAAFETACYVNEKWEKEGHRGKLVCFHCHTVVSAAVRAA
jgi:hypothetical protein